MPESRYKFIEIVKAGATSSGKTYIFKVYNKSQGIELAEIRWYAYWRQYCLMPGSGTVWSAGCLEDVLDFMRKLKN